MPANVLLSIDTASDITGAALHDDGGLLAEVTWLSHRNHSRELLPNIDWLLQRTGLNKDALSAIAVCLGPGSYAGMRVGLSTAKALAFGLGIPIVGIGRLPADAYFACITSHRRTVAVQTAGRAELAWGIYQATETADLREIRPPRLGPATALAAALRTGDLVCCELPGLNDDLRQLVESAGASLIEPAPARIMAIAALARIRLQRGEVDIADSLVPLYLRAPAIGPQTPV